MAKTRRGDVWLVDLGMAGKIRPCLVLSVPVGDQDRALATLVAHTTSPRGSQFESSVESHFLKSGVFDAQNLITVPHSKLMRRLGALSAEQLATVEEAVRHWLGL
jgi:mRNA interferase MazF